MRTRAWPVVLAVLAAAGCATRPSPPTANCSGAASAAPAAAATTCSAPPAAPTPPATPPVPPAPPESDFNTLGPADARVTIFEFSDLECPHCAQFATTTFPELRRRYIDTGKVRFVAHDRPLPMHPEAVAAAVAARCAGEQGKYWDYREAVFRSQNRLAAAPYEELARRFGLDLPAFAACRASGQEERRIRADVQFADTHGITSTPTLVIGRIVGDQLVGDTVVGAQPFAVYEQKIEALIAN